MIHYNPNPYKRYHPFESDGTVCSNTELLSRNHAHDPSIRTCLPEVGILPTGEICFANGQVKMLPNQPFSINQPDIPAWPFNIQPGCQPTLLQYTSSGYRIINRDIGLCAKFTMLRVFDMQNRINQMQPYYLSQYSQANSWDERDVQIARDLGAKFGISGGWRCSNINQNGLWAKSPIPQQILSGYYPDLIHVKNQYGAYIYSLKIFYFANGTYAVLPVAYFQNPFYRCSLELYIPPLPTYIWMNSEHLPQYPNAIVILTNDPLIAINNPPSNEYIFLGNPGGSEWEADIDIQCLHGRKIFLLVNIDRADLQSAANIAARLHSSDITPSFALIGQDLNLSAVPREMTTEIVSMRSFLKKAQSLGVYIPEAIQLTRNGAFDIEQIQTSFPLLENLVAKGEITFVIEHKGADLNIISSRILSALRSHVSPFSDHCCNLTSNPINCIVFLDAENIRRYLDLMKQSEQNMAVNDSEMLYDTRFLKESFEDGIKMFKDIIKTTSAKVVIFDSDSVWNEGAKSLPILKEALRFCLFENIAAVVTCSNKKTIENLLQPNRVVNLWKYGDKPFNHVVEFESLRNEDIGPFEFFMLDGKWISKCFATEKLTNIPGRIPNSNKPGVSTYFDDLLANASKEELLGLKSSNPATDNSKGYPSSPRKNNKHFFPDKKNSLLLN